MKNSDSTVTQQCINRARTRAQFSAVANSTVPLLTVHHLSKEQEHNSYSGEKSLLSTAHHQTKLAHNGTAYIVAFSTSSCRARSKSTLALLPTTHDQQHSTVVNTTSPEQGARAKQWCSTVPNSMQEARTHT